jgi:hypothetical protein
MRWQKLFCGLPCSLCSLLTHTHTFTLSHTTLHSLLPPPLAADPSPLVRCFSSTTSVTFDELDEATVRAYVASGEPFGKAGSYGIQGIAGECFVSLSLSRRSTLAPDLSLPLPLSPSLTCTLAPCGLSLPQAPLSPASTAATST